MSLKPAVDEQTKKDYFSSQFEEKWATLGFGRALASGRAGLYVYTNNWQSNLNVSRLTAVLGIRRRITILTAGK